MVFSIAGNAVEIMRHKPSIAEGLRKYRAPSLFQPHRTRDALRDAYEGKIPPLAGLYLGLSCVPVARLIAPMGFDVVWVDWEHSSCNVETMTDMVHEIIFMSEGRTVPFVRVPGHDHAAIGYALDAGASIVVPQVDTVEQAKHVVSSAKFGKKHNGSRSVPPYRLVPGIADIVSDPEKHADPWKQSNDHAAIMIQIESEEGMANLDAILTEVPDIDAVWLGTLDLRVSMGLPASVPAQPEPEFLAIVKEYIAITDKHKKPRGGAAVGPDDMFLETSKNLHFVLCAAEVFALRALSNDLGRARDLMADRVAAPNGKTANGSTSNGKAVNGRA